ncbi:hypothetical protein [Vibrio sp. 99-8-1]|uniref:hypothetical protein n=1 Tax=Vibrio sp. 99-8-1 TaxID=2607602 RepID=UPI001493C03C|nr:hypothetical protein [Vibrio sp. 99-8-1]NOI65418.1 hypothetical protein [Vibrio sp. 99-8-1]
MVQLISPEFKSIHNAISALDAINGDATLNSLGTTTLTESVKFYSLELITIQSIEWIIKA